MTNSTVSRLGQVNAAGDVDALFLKQFGGEILTEFEESTVFKTRHFVRQIRNGKTAQFPMIGTVGSSYHTPGNFIDGQTVKDESKAFFRCDLIIRPDPNPALVHLCGHVRWPARAPEGKSDGETELLTSLVLP